MIDRAQLDRWMAAAADGDRTAIDPLFHALWPMVVGYATRFLGDPVLAEDCAQEALVQLFSQLERYDRDRDALTWALTFAMWQCRTARKKVVRRGEVTVGTDQDGRSIDGNAVAIERELVRSALATLATLGPRDVEILVASLTEDDAMRSTIAPATFRKRLERAVARLRTSWKDRHGVH